MRAYQLKDFDSTKDALVTNDILVHRFEVNKGTHLHSHTFVEITYVTQGNGIHITEDGSEPIHVGDLLIINSNTPHRYAAEESNLYGINCLFSPTAVNILQENADDFIRIAYEFLFHTPTKGEIDRKYILLKCRNNAEIEQLLEAMYTEHATKKDGHRQILRSQLTQLLILMFRIYRESAHAHRENSIYKKLVVENSIKYMEAHLQNNITCALLAGNAYLSTGYFSKIFKEVTGKTVIAVLQEIRMQKACWLLTNTRATIAEITEQCGYGDIKYFYTVFLKFKGTTPGEYRRTHTTLPL